TRVQDLCRGEWWRVVGCSELWWSGRKSGGDRVTGVAGNQGVNSSLNVGKNRDGVCVPPLSPTYVPDPIELDEHVPVYVPELEQPGYHAPSDDDIQDPEEDPSKEHKPEDDDEDPEEDPNEDHESKEEDTKEEELSKGSDETESFEEDETAITPPPPRHRGARISVRPQTPMDASTQTLIDAFAAGSPTITRAVDKAEDVGYVRALHASEHRMMTSIEEVNLRISYQPKFAGRR
nr:hypothetical protein [Tanacetum cinerariifolium]